MQELKNYMEDVVIDTAKSIIGNMDCCTCEKCFYDIVAIALNSVPPKYVVTKKGELYTKIYSLQQQFDVDIISAITKAAALVGKSPRHEQ